MLQLKHNFISKLAVAFSIFHAILFLMQKFNCKNQWRCSIHEILFLMFLIRIENECVLTLTEQVKNWLKLFHSHSQPIKFNFYDLIHDFSSLYFCSFFLFFSRFQKELAIIYPHRGSSQIWMAILFIVCRSNYLVRFFFSKFIERAKEDDEQRTRFRQWFDSLSYQMTC